MSLFGRRNGDGDGSALPAAPVNVRQPIAALPPPREEYRDEDGMVWRCRCGATGISRESADRHVWSSKRGCAHNDIREYVPREVYQEEYTAKRAEVAMSGIWIVIKMPAETAEGSVAAKYKSRVRNAKSGLEAIKDWYSEQIAELTPQSTEADREEANGRYVAIDFFTGLRSEALVESDWRANVLVAEGSHA